VDSTFETSRSLGCLQNVRKVLVVGAGVAGLQTARHLLKAGFDVLVLESSDDVGGVWRSNYSGFGLQVPQDMYVFPDFPYPPELRPKEEFPTGREVHEYTRAYAKHFQLLPHIKFRCKLLQLRQTATGVWAAVYHDMASDKYIQVKADFAVIATGIYSQPFVPTYEGSDEFHGLQVHARDFHDLNLVKSRNVLIVGAGKSALDCVAEVLATKSAASVTMLYRQAHWPMPRVLGGATIRTLLFNRAITKALSPYYTEGRASRFADKLGAPIKRLFWRSIERLIMRQFKIRDDLRPAVGLPMDLFYGGQILDTKFDKLIRDNLVKTVRGEIHCFMRNGVILQNGSFVNADVVLFCTGYAKTYDYLAGDVRARLDIEKDGVYLYRNMIPPNIPNLAFVGAEVSTYNNILTDGIQALWLTHLLTGKMSLPPLLKMQEDVRQQQRWRRKVMPAQRHRGSVYMLYMQAYHDQLLADMSIKPKLKGWNPVKELFAAYTAADYLPVFARSVTDLAANSPLIKAKPNTAAAAAGAGGPAAATNGAKVANGSMPAASDPPPNPTEQTAGRSGTDTAGLAPPLHDKLPAAATAAAGRKEPAQPLYTSPLPPAPASELRGNAAGPVHLSQQVALEAASATSRDSRPGSVPDPGTVSGITSSQPQVGRLPPWPPLRQTSLPSVRETCTSGAEDPSSNPFVVSGTLSPGGSPGGLRPQSHMQPGSPGGGTGGSVLGMNRLYQHHHHQPSPQPGVLVAEPGERPSPSPMPAAEPSGRSYGPGGVDVSLHQMVLLPHPSRSSVELVLSELTATTLAVDGLAPGVCSGAQSLDSGGSRSTRPSIDLFAAASIAHMRQLQGGPHKEGSGDEPVVGGGQRIL